jgi:myo-inositol-1(or 4)-monophosphatase
VLNELYVAERGAGAFLNDKRLRVAVRKTLPDTVIATGAPHMGKDGHDQFLGEMGGLMTKTAGIRRCGSAALDLAWVASGRFDGFWERGLSPWDMAAGIVIVREAGGRVTGTSGNDDMLDSGAIVAGNEPIHAALLAELGKAKAK